MQRRCRRLAIVIHPALPLARCHVERKARIRCAALVELGRHGRPEAGWTDMPTHQVQFLMAQAAATGCRSPEWVRRLTLLRTKVGHCRGARLYMPGRHRHRGPAFDRPAGIIDCWDMLVTRDFTSNGPIQAGDGTAMRRRYPLHDRQPHLRATSTNTKDPSQRYGGPRLSDPSVPKPSGFPSPLRSAPV